MKINDFTFTSKYLIEYFNIFSLRIIFLYICSTRENFLKVKIMYCLTWLKLELIQSLSVERKYSWLESCSSVCAYLPVSQFTVWATILSFKSLNSCILELKSKIISDIWRSIAKSLLKIRTAVFIFTVNYDYILLHKEIWSFKAN